jgi:hypothetical protein
VDIDELLSVNTRAKPGSKCMVGVALGKLGPIGEPTRTKVEQALDDRDRFAADGIAAVFKALGHDMSRSPVERHRRGACQCPEASS